MSIRVFHTGRDRAADPFPGPVLDRRPPLRARPVRRVRPAPARPARRPSGDPRRPPRGIPFRSRSDAPPPQTVPAPVRRVPVRTSPTPAPRPAREPVRAPVRLTRRGRVAVTTVVLALLLALVLGLVLTLLVVVGAGPAATSAPGGPSGRGERAPTRVVEVAEGDTLWGIASQVAAPGEVREVVYRIKELNGLSGSGLAEGQRLVVPAR